MDDEENRKSVFRSDSIRRMILTMAVPTVISQIITVLYNYADTILYRAVRRSKTSGSDHIGAAACPVYYSGR